MDLLERLRSMVQDAPPGTAITLPADWLRRELGMDAEAEDVPHDLTLEELAEKLGRAVSTARGWCAAGLLPGAYKLRGKEWRVPPGALQAFLRAEAEQKGETPRTRGRRANLGRWRSVRKATT